jgi:hypothetical protein
MQIVTINIETKAAARIRPIRNGKDEVVEVIIFVILSKKGPTNAITLRVPF